ncbi:putative ribonuclease H-like domain-containing protein [Tanacetum coccineum]
MALPEDHLAKFHKMIDAKEMWEAINLNLVFENDVKGSTASSSSTQNVAFVSENTSSTNDVSTAYGVSNPSGHNSQYEQTSSYSLLANQSSCPQLDHEDLEQLDEFDLEEMDLKWQVAMISMRMKKFYKKTGRKLQFDAKEPVGFDKTKVECYNCHKTRHFARECRTKGNQDSKRRDAWNSRNKDGRRSGKQEDSKALVTIDGEGVDWTSHSEEEEDYALMACNSSGSDTEVISCSKECKESYAEHKKLYDKQRAQLSDASIEIHAYTQALKKVEAQLVAHQQEAEKEKEDLKAKVEKWHNSSKNLGKLLNTQMSANDKFGLGYGDHRYDGILSYENEVLQSVFMNKESDLENQPLYDRFVTAEGMHVSQPSESETQTSDFDTCESDCSVETHESLLEPTVNKPKVVSKPKVWSNAPIIEEYESDSEDEHEIVKNQFTHSKNPKVDKKGLGYEFTTKSCFVCGSLSHLIRDCDFHEKRMAKQAELNNKMRKKSTVLTRTGKIPVSTARASGTKNVSNARHNFNSQAVLTNAARKISTVKTFVNRVRPKTIFHKTHSPFRRPFNNTIALRTNFSKQKVDTAEENAVSAVGEKWKLLLSPQQVVIGDQKDIISTKSPNTMVDQDLEIDYPHRALKNKGIVDSRCSRHMTRNKEYLAEYQDFNGGPVAFGGSKAYITGKGKNKTEKLDFEDVCFVKELLHFNIFSVSQMCDKKNNVIFTDTECLVLSPEFKLPDANQVLLRSPRQNNMYSFNLENLVPSGGLACLIAKVTIDESNKWHRRLGHVNFKNINKLVKGNLVRGLPSKIFQNDHTCVACQKGKQQATQGLLCDNGTEFKNRDFIELCGSKGIKREYSNARTPQQNGVAERKNMTLIEAAWRTKERQAGKIEESEGTLCLADLQFLPNTFWAEAVSTACYVLNRVLVTKPQNKTPYELVTGKIPIISYIRPFGCHVTILNTIDHLGKFDGKSDEGFLVGYSLQSKAFRVYNLETKRVEENLHITFLENKPNVAGKGPTWLFDLDYLTDSMNYQPVRSENQANKHAGPQEANQNAVKSSKVNNAGEEPTKHPDFKQVDKEDQDLLLQAGAAKASSTNIVNTASTPVSTASPYGGLSFTDLTNTDQDDSEIPALEEIYDNPTDGIFTNSSYDDEGAVADFTNLEPVVNVSPIPTSRINSIHPSTLILGDPQSAVQTRSKVTKSSGAYAFVSYIQKQRRNNHKDFQHCLFACFLSQNEPKKISEALEDESWVDAMQEELLQFKIHKFWILVDLPYGKKAIGTKWVYRNKKDERGVVVRNKARLVGQGHRQEERIDYDEVFAPVARIETIRIFLAFSSYMGFIVYQMDVKSAFLYGKINEGVYVSQPPGFINPKYPKKVYKVVKALYGLHQAPRAWYATLSTFLLKNGYKKGTIDKTLFIKKDKHDIILVQVYVDDIIFEILKKFDFVSVKTASTPIKTQKPLVKYEEVSDVDVHLYRSMIGSLMYLTASRPDIMFAVCACSRFQVTQKTTHLSVVKRIFRYLKGKPKLGLWYPRVSSFDLEAYSDSDYAGANLDRKSTTGVRMINPEAALVKGRQYDLLYSLDKDGLEALLLPNLFILALTIVSIDSAKLIPLGKDSTAIETLKKISPRVVLESCPKHNMVAYLEKTAGNVEFHEVIDFLARSSIHNALTVSLVVSTTFVKQFWMSAKSKNINNVRYITAKVAGKPVSISEASIRSDLLFDDADGIDSLPNQAIFDAIQLMGYEGDLTVLTFNKALHLDAKKKFVMYPRIFLDKQLMNVLVPLDHFPVNALTSKVFSFMVKKANVEPQSDTSPRPSPTPHIPDSIPESSGRNHRGHSSSDKSLPGNEGDMTLQSVYNLCISLCTQVTDQAKEIKHLKAQNKKLKKKAKPVITHHRAWMKSVSLKQRLAGKKSLKKQWMQKESLADDMLDYMDTENAQDIGRSRFVVHEEKEREEKEVSTEDVVSTDKEKVSIDRSKVSTNRSKVSTDRSRVSTDKEEVSTDNPDDQTEGKSATPTTQTPTPTTFGDDETIAQVLLNMSQAKEVSREKEKGVELKDVEETDRPRPTSTRSLLTLKPLPKIDPKDKGKKKIEEEDESDTESEGIPEAKKKFNQLARDEKMVRKVQEDWEAEEVKKLAEEEAIKTALSNKYDYIQERIEADRLLALRLQDEEREESLLWKREQSSFMIQLQLKEGFLQNKELLQSEINLLQELTIYEKVKRFDESFTTVGSIKDERRIKEMNEGVKDPDQKSLKKRVAKETSKKEDTTKVPAKVDVTEQGTKKRKGGHIKMLARKRKRPQSDVDSDDEHRKCLKIVTFEGTMDSEIMERKSVIARLNKVSSPDGDYLVIYRANGNFRAFNCLLEVLHIFDRQDLFHLYDLVMEQYSEITLEGIELILWGDLKIMMESSQEENDQKLKDGTVIHMLVERRYPLSKDLLQRILDLGLEVERESTTALDLIRFIKQQIDEN